MATTADFKNGLVLNIDGQLWTITEFQHVKPGKGPAFVRIRAIRAFLIAPKKLPMAAKLLP